MVVNTGWPRRSSGTGNASSRARSASTDMRPGMCCLFGSSMLWYQASWERRPNLRLRQRRELLSDVAHFDPVVRARLLLPREQPLFHAVVFTRRGFRLDVTRGRERTRAMWRARACGDVGLGSGRLWLRSSGWIPARMPVEPDTARMAVPLQFLKAPWLSQNRRKLVRRGVRFVTSRIFASRCGAPLRSAGSPGRSRRTSL